MAPIRFSSLFERILIGKVDFSNEKPTLSFCSMKMRRNFFIRWESLRFFTKLIQCRDLSSQLCSSKEFFNFAKIFFLLCINIEQNLFHLNDFQFTNTSTKSICRAKRSISSFRHMRTVLQMDTEQRVSLKWESKVFVSSRSVNRDKRNTSTFNYFTPLRHIWTHFDLIE